MADAAYLETPLRRFKGVGPRREQALRKIGVEKVEDLLLRLPLRYEDRTSFTPVAAVPEGERVTVAGELINCRLRWTGRRGFKVFEAVVRDESGGLLAVWPNQPYRQNTIRAHARAILHGPVVRYRGVLQLSNPDIEILDEDGGDPLHTGRIVPVYEKAGPVTARMQRRLVHEVLQGLPPDLDDLLPGALREAAGLPGRAEALRDTHFPPAGTPPQELERFRTPAARRLIFEEFFLFQAGLLERRAEAASRPKPLVPRVDDRVRASVRAALPFRLTAGQRQALAEIVEDMRRPAPMNRLLQGDVGSGKTVVAALAALVALENGFQVALMVPTEILAEQHLLVLSRLFAQTGFRPALLTGATPAA
ncbi:MAG TPA: DEAD/DEAH box helicase, partial [Vicinamibacterales bacterium]|nr:DEAD/DEAH box helicase [Vicinamibacterales bacterium]